LVFGRDLLVDRVGTRDDPFTEALINPIIGRCGVAYRQTGCDSKNHSFQRLLAIPSPDKVRPYAELSPGNVSVLAEFVLVIRMYV
jgi:hypothetical protein